MAVFGTSVNCIDGRVQNPIADWMRKNLQLEYIDVITEPGCDLVLSDSVDEATLETIRKKVSISQNAHSSKIVAVSGHHDCAANPANKEQHIAQILKAVDTIKSWNLGLEVIGLWVDENWNVERVDR